MNTPTPKRRKKVVRGGDSGNVDGGENNWNSTNLNPMLIDNVLDVLFDKLPLVDLKKSREVCKLWNTKIIDKMSNSNPAKLNFNTSSKVDNFFVHFRRSRNKKIYKACETLHISTSMWIFRKILSRSFLNEDSKHKNVSFAFSNVNRRSRIEFSDLISMILSFSSQLKSLEFICDEKYPSFEGYFKYNSTNYQDIHKGLTWPEFNKLETLKMLVQFKMVQFLENLIRNNPPKLRILELSYCEFPGVGSPQNALILPLAGQLTKLAIDVEFQRGLGFGSSLVNLSVHGLKLKSLLLDVKYGIYNNLLLAQEVQMLSNFFTSQGDTLEELKLHLTVINDFVPPAGFMGEINLPVFENVQNLELFVRRDYHDAIYLTDIDEYGIHPKFLTSRILLSEMFPKLTKISCDSRNFERILNETSPGNSLVKNLKWTFTKRGSLPQNLQLILPGIEELEINYPSSRESLHFLHPHIKGQQIPWKETLKNLTIHYPAYDLGIFDFGSLNCFIALEHLKFICIPVEGMSEGYIVPDFEQYLQKNSNLISISFENYKIRAEQVRILGQNNPRFKYIYKKD